MNAQTDIKLASNRIRTPTQSVSNGSGNVLVYIVVMLLIFGVLGTTLFSIFSTATRSASEPNHLRRVNYIAESATRYAFSEMRNSNFDPNVINTLNTTTYEVDKDGEFEFTIFGPWFHSDETVNLPTSGNTIDLKLFAGELNPDWVARDPDSLWLVNYEYINLGLASARDPIDSWAYIDATTLEVTLAGDFIANKGELICLAVEPIGTQSIALDDDPKELIIAGDARYFFPAYGGAVNINRIDYIYRELTYDLDQNEVTLKGISAAGMPNTDAPFPLTVEDTESEGNFSGDFIVLSPRNHIVMRSATDNVVTIEDTLENALSLYNLATIPRKADIDLNQENLETVLNQIETPGFITEDNTNKTIDIGSGITGQADFGAVWFGGGKGIGGKNPYCELGECEFGLGIRAFFTLDYSGTADGLTFALINAAGNSDIFDRRRYRSG